MGIINSINKFENAITKRRRQSLCRERLLLTESHLCMRVLPAHLHEVDVRALLDRIPLEFDTRL